MPPSDVAAGLQLLRCQDDVTLAKAVAQAWLGYLQVNPAASCSVALSGGRIAQRFFAEIAGQARNSGAALDKVEFFWADERCVPPTHPESNFKLAQEHLLAPLAINPSRVHRIRGEAQPDEAVREVAARLCQI